MRIYVKIRLLLSLLPAGLVMIAGPLPAQKSEREDLKQPVFRVEKSDDGRIRPTDGEPRTAMATSAGSSVKPDQITQEVAEKQAPPALQSDATLAEAALPEPQISEAVASFSQALQDAEATLKHIRENVRDYTCLFIKRENVNGTILPAEYVQTKVRNRRVENGQIVTPFSVYMKFVKPPSVAGRQVLFIEGENNGKMLVKEGGPKGRFLPPIWLNPSSRFVMGTNRYEITEMGIENLTQRLLDRGRADRDIESCIVTYRPGAKVAGRVCQFMEVKRPEPKTGELAKYGMNVYLARVFMDQELNVPIRYAAYDWPSRTGERPPVIEEYTYHNLKVNVGLTEDDFDSKNPKYSF